MAFKIAYNAGHILATAGKRLAKELDPTQTREWVLNDRVARAFAEEMAKYEGVELRRMDDPKGIEPIDIDERVARANIWGADFYLSIHHNAAGRLFSGGGIEVYLDATGGPSEQYARAIYKAMISATGLVGDRSDPIRSGDEAPMYETRATNMPAVLVECGYMDSYVDAPQILREEFSRSVGIAIARAVADVAKLQRKEGEEMGKRYNTIEEIPDYGKATIKRLVNTGLLSGTDKGLDLSEDMLRILVILGRANVI